MPARASFRSSAQHPARPPSRPLTGPAVPAMIDAVDLIEQEFVRPPEIVTGLMHRGSKIMLAGGSKTFKTWTFMDLAVSIACGVPWWDFPTAQGRVLYVNFEIQDVFFRERLLSICDAKNVTLTPGQLDYQGLRGFAGDASKIVQELLPRLEGREYALIIIDPIYKCYGDREENSATAMADLLNQFEKLAVQSGAAVLYGHHFSKGNQSGKDSIDRASGSGAFARDADTIITMTPHEEDDAFTVECTLRNFPPLDKFVVKREHPLMVRDTGLNPSDVRRSANRETYSDEVFLAPLRERPMTNTEWQEAVMSTEQMSPATFQRRIKKLASKVLCQPDGCYRLRQ